MPKKKSNPIETYVEDVVKKILDERESQLKEEDAREIIKAMLPEIESIVSKVILSHFHALASYVKTNLKDPKEK